MTLGEVGERNDLSQESAKPLVHNKDIYFTIRKTSLVNISHLSKQTQYQYKPQKSQWSCRSSITLSTLPWIQNKTGRPGTLRSQKEPYPTLSFYLRFFCKYFYYCHIVKRVCLWHFQTCLSSSASSFPHHLALNYTISLFVFHFHINISFMLCCFPMVCFCILCLSMHSQYFLLTVLQL